MKDPTPTSLGFSGSWTTPAYSAVAVVVSHGPSANDSEKKNIDNGHQIDLGLQDIPHIRGHRTVPYNPSLFLTPGFIDMTWYFI